MEHPSLIIRQDVFDKMIDSSVELVKQIQAKEGKEEEIITQEEASFVNAFVEYAKELIKKVKEDNKLESNI